MKRKNITLSLLLIFLIFVLELSSEIEEKAYYDGYDWEKWSFEIRFGYIIGIGEGIGNSLAIYKSVKNLVLEKLELIEKLGGDKPIIDLARDNIKIYDKYVNPMDITNIKYIQIIDGINSIYKDYANKNISIIDILPLVLKRIKGEITKEELEKELKQIRSVYK